MWHTYYAPRTVAETLELLAHHGDACRLIAGGTDLILEIERGVRQQQIIVDISRIADLGAIELGDTWKFPRPGPRWAKGNEIPNRPAIPASLPRKWVGLE